jgi:hypothetical protein
MASRFGLIIISVNHQGYNRVTINYHFTKQTQLKNNVYFYSTLLNQIYNHFFNGQFFIRLFFKREVCTQKYGGTGKHAQWMQE